MTATIADNTREITDQQAALEFIFGGNARFTLVSKNTGKRYTYRVSKSKDGDLWFAGVLTGPDNGAYYQYIGFTKGGRLIAGKKGTPEHTAFKALDWTLNMLTQGVKPTALEFWHEGRCCRCGRALTVPASIESGIGPECAKKA